ncbi:MAG: DNA polymerase III subunit epsilon [Alphaproteobacteria bacterium]|nr:DNA polymerase III subunit epsilon [Alphaproteobacteria bacterium]
MREIVLDTETTGLSPAEGHRVVELGCVELINHVPTGRHWHQYFNPERDMPEDARRIHGLDDAFLVEKPLFAAEAGSFLDFVAADTLVIHNAGFDIGFLNAEFERIGFPALKNPIIDTVKLARDVNPGARASLDALCKLYGIDNSRRTLHGALLDSEILADVYLELIGGRQVALALSAEAEAGRGTDTKGARSLAPKRPETLPPRLGETARTEHDTFVAGLGDKAIWVKYRS